jgi:hypothetical protein
VLAVVFLCAGGPTFFVFVLCFCLVLCFALFSTLFLQLSIVTGVALTFFYFISPKFLHSCIHSVFKFDTKGKTVFLIIMSSSNLNRTSDSKTSTFARLGSATPSTDSLNSSNNHHVSIELADSKQFQQPTGNAGSSTVTDGPRRRSSVRIKDQQSVSGSGCAAAAADDDDDDPKVLSGLEVLTSANEVWQQLKEEDYFESKAAVNFMDKLPDDAIAVVSRCIVADAMAKSWSDKLDENSAKAAHLWVLSHLQCHDDSKKNEYYENIAAQIVPLSLGKNLMHSHIDTALNLVFANGVFGPESESDGLCLSTDHKSWSEVNWNYWIKKVAREHHLTIWKFGMVMNAVQVHHDDIQRQLRTPSGDRQNDKLSAESEVMQKSQAGIDADKAESVAVVKQKLDTAFAALGLANAAASDLNATQLRVLFGTAILDRPIQSTMYGKSCAVPGMSAIDVIHAIAESHNQMFVQTFEMAKCKVTQTLAQEQNNSYTNWTLLMLLTIWIAICALNVIEMDNSAEFVNDNMNKYECLSSFEDVGTRTLLSTLSRTQFYSQFEINQTAYEQGTFPLPGCSFVSVCKRRSGGSVVWICAEVESYSFIGISGVGFGIIAIILFEWLFDTIAFPTKTLAIAGALIMNFLADPRVEFNGQLVMGVASSNFIRPALYITSISIGIMYVILCTRLHRTTLDTKSESTICTCIQRGKTCEAIGGIIMSIVFLVGIAEISIFCIFAPAAVASFLGTFPELYTVESILNTSRNGANSLAFASALVGSLLFSGIHTFFASLISSKEETIKAASFDVEAWAHTASYRTDRVYFTCKGQELASFVVLPSPSDSDSTRKGAVKHD